MSNEVRVKVTFETGVEYGRYVTTKVEHGSHLPDYVVCTESMRAQLAAAAKENGYPISGTFTSVITKGSERLVSRMVDFAVTSVRGVVKSSDDWAEEKGIMVADPDGWDRKHYLVSWFEEITEAEFDRRVSLSTVIRRR